MIAKRFDFLAERLAGPTCSAANAASPTPTCYVMLRWARMTRQDVPEPLPAFFERMEARPAVQLALQHEGLS